MLERLDLLPQLLELLRGQLMQQAFELIASLKQSERAKSACGARLIARYEDLAKGLGRAMSSSFAAGLSGID